MNTTFKNRMSRLAQIVLLSITGSAYADTLAPPAGLEYFSVGTLKEKMASNELGSVELVHFFRNRIDALDKQGPTINAVIELNPDALAIAAERDAERRQGYIRGPLHGIPVLLKDNIDTADQMQTSAGSLAMVGQPAANDAFIVQQLRASGAVILGKTNLSEWANFRDPEIPSGWSGRGDQTKNPHLLSADPCGSSSGSAAGVAAGFAPLAVGTETAGSIICPASMNGVVGLKPTVGLLSRSGIIPVTQKLDTPGPMARSVEDAALLLNAMAGNDPADPATQPHTVIGRDYTALLAYDALKGRRIGYPSTFEPGSEAAQSDPHFFEALQVMRALGATLIPVELIDPQSQRVDEGLWMGIKRDLSAYLANRSGIAVHNLQDLLAFNEANPTAEGHGQLILNEANAVPFSERAYDELWRTIQNENGAVIENLLAEHRLDALVSDVASPAMNVVPLAGYPGIMVPSGMGEDGVPTSVFFYGARWSEASLLALAYSYEHASQARSFPDFKPE